MSMPASAAALTLYRPGSLESANRKLLDMLVRNLYLLPALVGSPIARQVGVAVVDRRDETVYVVEDAVLDDTRAAELGKAGSDGAAEVVHGPGNFDGIFGAALRVGVARRVLREAERLLRDVLAEARGKHGYLVEPLAVVEQLDRLLRARGRCRSSAPR